MTDAVSQALHALQATLDDARAGRLPTAALARQWREHAARLTGLPARYAEVLDQVLTPLESAGLFSEESCSYSQQDQLGQLAQWLAHARQRLGAPPA